jgi:hypothetical protein
VRDDVDLKWLRRQLIASLAQDPVLFYLLVLKGGNALGLLHGVGHRASLDLDSPMKADVKSPSALGDSVFHALRARLEPQGLLVFDEKFSARPSLLRGRTNPTWGGYLAEFKIISRARAEELRHELDSLRKQAMKVSGDPQAERRFRIEISKFECCEPKERILVDDGVVCHVYALELIVAEKLRALCQQMDDYALRAHPAPRARDFYDIHAVITESGVELSEDSMRDLVAEVFRAESVHVRLLSKIAGAHDFHEPDWASVQNTIPAGRPGAYDFYFKFVVEQVRKLQPLWMEDLP